MVTVFGDVSSLSSIVAAIPLILTEMGYSRAFEREADQFAHELVEQVGIEPRHFAAILTKLEQYAACRPDEGEAVDEACRGDDRERADRSVVFDYLSTHPPTGERVRQFQDRQG